MVKATAEARIEFTNAGDGSIIANLAAKCKQEVTVEVTKKLRTLSLRKLFFPVKGRRKDKDASAVPQDDNKRYLEEELSREKVLDADWEKLVGLPSDIDRSEWLATHTLSFFDHINMIYGSVSEYCTSTVCSTMSGPGNTQYQWVDEKGKKCKCVAPQYVEYVMTFVKKTIHDETVFPTKFGNVFPPSFDTTVKKVHRLLFHVIAHLYQAHYSEMVVLRLHPHLNTLFEHFVTFSRQFSLVEDKQTELLDDLYQKLRSGASLQKDATGDGDHLPPPAQVTEDSCTGDGKAGGVATDRLSGPSPARPTTLPCGQEYGHKSHQSNGSAAYHHDSHHDDNKENVHCDSNQSQSALSPMATPMST